MTITDRIKILNKKILQNEVQYDLDKSCYYLHSLLKILIKLNIQLVKI